MFHSPVPQFLLFYQEVNFDKFNDEVTFLDRSRTWSFYHVYVRMSEIEKVDERAVRNIV